MITRKSDPDVEFVCRYQCLVIDAAGPKARDQIVDRFAAFPLLSPDREDHIAAADLRNHCRKRGVQVGTIDALLGRLCIRHDLTLLTTDDDFTQLAKHCELRLWDG